MYFSAFQPSSASCAWHVMIQLRIVFTRLVVHSFVTTSQALQVRLTGHYVVCSSSGASNSLFRSWSPRSHGTALADLQLNPPRNFFMDLYSAPNHICAISHHTLRSWMRHDATKSSLVARREGLSRILAVSPTHDLVLSRHLRLHTLVWPQIKFQA